MSQSASSLQFFTAFQMSDIWFLAEAAGRTLLIAAVSIPGGTVLGIFFGWVLSVSRWAGAGTLGMVLDMFRSVPLIIQLILFFNFFPIIGVPLDPFEAGALVLVFYTSALVAAVARGGIGISLGEGMGLTFLFGNLTLFIAFAYLLVLRWRVGVSRGDSERRALEKEISD